MANKKHQYTIEKIVQRYTNAIRDLAEVQMAINVHDKVQKEKSESDAGEALSQTLEWALRNHIHSFDPSYFDGSSKVSTPQMILDCYLDETTEKDLFLKTLTSERPTVDFAFLRQNKQHLTNLKKHLAENLSFDIQKKYAVEVAKFINEYLDDKVRLLTLEKVLEPENDSEQAFYMNCNSFLHEDCLYILLLDTVPFPSSCYNNLSRANWDLVIDMYMGSDDNGFIKNSLSADSVPYKIISLKDQLSADTFPLYNGEVPVIMANGFKQKAISCSKARDWSKMYTVLLQQFMQQFFSVHTEQRVIVVSLLHDVEFVRQLFYCIDAYARGLSFIIANDPNQTMDSLPDQIADCILCSNMSAQDVNQCIGHFLPNNTVSGEVKSYQIPAKEGVYSISSADMRSYEENFEVLYEGIGNSYEETEEDYLKGATTLTWEAAHRKFAPTRNDYNTQYVSKIEKELSKGARRAMIIHEAGYGGTTLARQIAYDLHRKYPILILKQYKNKSLKTQIEYLYDHTRKSVLVIAEIPQVLTVDEFDRLQQSLDSSRPILLLGVKRGTSLKRNNTLELLVPDWGNDVCLLVDKFKPYLKRYNNERRTSKEKMLNEIATGTSESYMRTPFYIGLLTFEEDFYAIDSYIKKFVKPIIGNGYQKKVLVYLSLCDYFGAIKSIPEGFFATVFDEDNSKGLFRLEKRFHEADGIVKSLLVKENKNGANYWSIRYPLFSDKLLHMLLNGIDSKESAGLMNLADYCKQFICDISRSDYREFLKESVLQQLLIGTKAERNGEKFTKIISSMSSVEQEDVLKTLHDEFPTEAHFCSHLARFYSSVNKDFNRALELADQAITLSSDYDAMLYHIKAMCYSHEIGTIIDNYRKQQIKHRENEKRNLEHIINDLLPEANENFSLARQYQHDDDKEVTYLPNIYMLIKLFDYAIDVNELERKEVLSEAVCPYCDWIDQAQSLLEILKQSYFNNESEDYTQCESALWNSIREFSEVIELLNNQLDKGKNTSLIRRLLARTYFKKEGFKKEQKLSNRVRTLMEENIAANPTEESNYILWFNAARYSAMTIEAVLSKMNQWKALNPSKDILFYCFVLYAIKALNNDTPAVVTAQRLLQQCRDCGGSEMIKIKEWYVDTRLGIMKHYELPSDWEARKRVYGNISSYKHPGDAHIELSCGLDVFFKPSASGITEANLNQRVSCLIGFSYDGIRALDDSVRLEEN